MPDSETTDDSIEEQVEELQSKVEDLEEQSIGKNQIRLEAYDLKIKASSEETGMRELLSMCSAEMDDMMKQALIGEYQEMERQDLFDRMLGDD